MKYRIKKESYFYTTNEENISFTPQVKKFGIWFLIGNRTDHSNSFDTIEKAINCIEADKKNNISKIEYLNYE